MSLAEEQSNRRMLRARDATDRCYAAPLDIAMLARSVRAAAPSCFSMAWTRPRSFGESPRVR